ncbi:MAG TPA: glycosyltransferase, partial [Armatimonadetes bacterium]|nr:glycosyltransferase [Armatimonadota bacterium]
EPPRHTVPYRTFVPGSRPWDPDRVAAVVRSFRPEVVVTLGEFPHLLPLVEVLAGRTIWIGALAEAAESASPLWADLLEALDWCLLPTRRACRAAQTVVPSARVQVMPLGVEAAVFRPLRSRHRLRQEVGLENSFVLGCLAPNQTRVQWPQILDALAPFGRAHEEVFLYLHTTPDGPAWDLIDLLRRRGLLAQAGFTPELTTGKPLPDEDLNEIYNLLDVVVVLDSSDALGLTLWEAQAAGVPVVALATSTAQERLGRQGPFVQVAAWWTDPVTEHAWPLVGPESLREQLEALYRDVAWRSALRRQGRRRARGHSWEGAIRAWSDLLETALSLAPRHRRPAGERVLWARRDGGMGDVIFALSALVARQAQEPELRIEFCTRPEHVAWVRWFDWLHCVSPSQAPPKGAEVVDFNRFDPNFPGDRARGMGYVLGAPVAELVMPPCIPPRVRERATRWLPEERSGRLIGFAPCADRRPPGRSWSLAQITRFLDLIDPEDTILLFDRKPLPLAPRPNLINTSGQLSQVEALALLSHCEAFVGLDSGLLYAAAMFRIPILGLFTHISPLHRLGTTAAFIALCPSLPCAPCGDLLDLTFGCTRPWGREFACVQLLRPEVAAELLPRLFTHPPPRQVVRLDSAGRRTEWDLEPLAPSFRGELTSIVVLNHNTWRSCTRACLEHLRRTTVPPYEIVLVDNGSDPAEVEQIHRELPPGVKLVLNPYNWGFPRGVNRGLERVSPRARLVCLLNSDCYVQERCWNQKVRRLFDDHWRWGAVSLTRGERRYFLDGETGEEYSYPEADAHTGECEIINGACL